MSNIQLKLDFLKRILLDGVTPDIANAFFSTKAFPDDSLMLREVALPLDYNRTEGSDWPSKAHTMIGLKRLNNLNRCLDIVRANNISGDFIETGVWRGGACIFMQMYCRLYNLNRRVFVADSFQGMPVPAGNPSDVNNPHHIYNHVLAISKAEVESNFKAYNALDSNVIFLEGWFKDTLPNNPYINKLSLLRLDGDMYLSTSNVLNSLWDKLETGGAIIIDDYALEGCRNALHDFRNYRGITTEIRIIDRGGAYWVKE